MIVPGLKQKPDFYDEIRANFLSETAGGKAYIDRFYAHSNELIKIFIANPKILLMWDELLTGLYNQDMHTEKPSKEIIEKMKVVLDDIYVLASENLKVEIIKHKIEIDYFPNIFAYILFSFYFF